MTSKREAERDNSEYAALVAELQEEFAGWERLGAEAWALIDQWEKEWAEGKGPQP